MANVTLVKWGNSQGVIIPKVICEEINLKVGDSLSLDVEEGQLVMKPKRREKRIKELTMKEIFKGWIAAPASQEDYSISNNEFDWGEPVGDEMW